MKNLKVSRMSGKLLGLEAINTNPLTNPTCMKMVMTSGTVCSHCYSIRILKTYRKNCEKPWEKNSSLLSRGAVGIDFEYPRFTPDLIRFHAHGELLNSRHLENFFLIASRNPYQKFALWTKRRDLIGNVWHRPENLVIIYSELKLDPKKLKVPAEDAFDKVFGVYSEHGEDFNCQGKSCLSCRICYSRDGDKIIKEKIK